jgi:hypothetical protein
MTIEKCYVSDCLNDVGLALTVGPDKCGDTAVEFDAYLVVAAEVVQAEGTYVHGLSITE